MEFIVVGCGRVGSTLALRLYQRGHQVTVIDSVGSSFEHLDPAYRGRTVEAEVLNEGVLVSAGVEQADGLAAVTNLDPVNAVVGHLARAVYGVQSVVVRNYNPRWRPLHQELGLTMVGSTSWGAQRFEELLCEPGIRTVRAADRGEVAVVEVTVPGRWAGRTIDELLPEGCRALALTHAGKTTLPAGLVRLADGDLLMVGAEGRSVAALRAQLADVLPGRGR